MPKIPLSIRIDQSLIDLIKQQAQEKKLEISELIREAIEHYQSCKIKEKEETKQASLKLIITKYNGKCSKCNNPISIGSLAYYGKEKGDTILICLDCMVENKSDKALASRYLKMRELDKTVRALRREAENLALKLDDLQILNKFDNIYQKNDEVAKLIFDYLKNPFINENERKAWEDILEQIKENKRIARDIEDFIQSKLRMPKMKREVKYYEQ